MSKKTWLLIGFVLGWLASDISIWDVATIDLGGRQVWQLALVVLVILAVVGGAWLLILRMAKFLNALARRVGRGQ